MACEPERKSGYRHVGGLYLTGKPLHLKCPMIPYPLSECKCCGQHINQTRGIQFIHNPQLLFKDAVECSHTYPVDHPLMTLEEFETICENVKNHCTIPCSIHGTCPLLSSDESNIAMMWVGKEYHENPSSFIEESLKLGISKRIASIPKNLELGKTWIVLAHPEIKIASILPDGEIQITSYPGLISMFIPTAIEMPMYKQDITPELKKKASELNITIIPIDNGDKDHHPNKPGLKRMYALFNDIDIEVHTGPKTKTIDEFFQEDQ